MSSRTVRQVVCQGCLSHAAPTYRAATVADGPLCDLRLLTWHLSPTRRFDALAGYLSALLRDDASSNGSGSGGSLDAAAAAGWPATHVIGKDILRFHAVGITSASACVST